MARRRPKWSKRDDAPRWARLSSWIVGAVVWLWIINDHLVRDLPEASVLGSAGAELFLNGLYFVAVATVVAAFAMYFVRLIGRTWLKLRG